MSKILKSRLNENHSIMKLRNPLTNELFNHETNAWYLFGGKPNPGPDDPPDPKPDPDPDPDDPDEPETGT